MKLETQQPEAEAKFLRRKASNLQQLNMRRLQHNSQPEGHANAERLKADKQGIGGLPQRVLRAAH